jgi:SAM-dependent methyltransferase
MAHFKSAQESHAHSRQTMDAIYEFDTFLDSLEVVADMGCGAGLDAQWWSVLETRDEPPEPRNYYTYAVDKNIKRIDASTADIKRFRSVEADFETVKLPRKVDLMWCHDSFQYSTNPLETLRHWNSLMTTDGMLILIVNQNIRYEYNRLVDRTESQCYFNHNVCNLIYMLSVNGFDCNDAYILKNINDPWIHIAVYKSSIEPMDPKTTTLFNLADLNLLHPSVVNSLNRWGHLRQEDIIYPWLDKDWHRPKN